MNLPVKIASQYLFTDKFFSPRGLLINGILSITILGLLYFDIQWGVPLLIMQLLPFRFVERNFWGDWGLKLVLAIVMIFSIDALRYGVLGLLLFQLLKENQAFEDISFKTVSRAILALVLGVVTILNAIRFFKYPKLNSRFSFFLALVVISFLFYNFWIGVMIYVLGLFLQQLFLGKRNAVHLISRISVLGISVGTTALILVLSVFNGFEDLIIDLFDAFNPDVKITAKEGKVFVPDSAQVVDLFALDAVETVSETLEEVAFFEYDGSQDFGMVKGVDDNFKEVSNVDSNIIRGFYGFKSGKANYAVLGSGMEYKLNVNVENQYDGISIYMPKRKRTTMLQNAFKKRLAYPLGTFAIQQEFDDQFILVDIEFARELMSYEDEVSALELKITDDISPSKAIKEIKAVMGEDFNVKDRYRQNESFFKLMNAEKWIGFAVLSFTLLLVSFNMVGALWMLVLDKKKDIAILKSMGTEENTIQRIFLNKGILLALLGGLVGMYIALIFYFFQIHVELIKLAGSANLLVDAYPISLRWLDFVLVFLTVVFIGLVAAWLPSIRAKKVQALIREE
jgi:lipoprotein-releasing system permease protein